MDDVPALRGPRLTALIIDHLVVWAILLLVAVSGTFVVSDPTAPTGGVLFSGVLYVPLFLCYKAGMEGYYGQTVGKSARGITVRHVDGSRCSWRGAVVRNAVLTVDYLPMLYGLGWYVASRSERRQRLGDLGADTVVVGQAT